ncbi:tail fiber assembly protein [Photorhabdus akhurstii]|uniref:tail fiber assembly protein n=1 Tax=Photorhabdus akhurstii TaxID=171438 RepID=UPI001FE983F2|nr:tail fiber assembly protein [Photorhabdus akhurstii]
MNKPSDKAVGENTAVESDNNYVATKEELIQQAEHEKSQLLTRINNLVAPLQDAVDLGIATEAEKNVLLEWKKYRVVLSKVDISLAPDVEWPEQPK